MVLAEEAEEAEEETDDSPSSDVELLDWLADSSVVPSRGAESGREAGRREANGFEAGRGEANGCEADVRAAGGREGNGREWSDGGGNARDRAELLPSPPRLRITDSCQASDRSEERLLPVLLLRLYI